MKAQRGSRGIALLILDPGASWGWVAALPRERPGTHCIGGWVGRAGLDVCEKTRRHRVFFFFFFFFLPERGFSPLIHFCTV
jgi:hypothetical protein